MERSRGKDVLPAFGPLYYRYAARVEDGIKVEELDFLWSLKPVQVHVEQLQATLVLVYEGERGASNEIAHAERSSEPFYEGRLAAPEVSMEGDD